MVGTEGEFISSFTWSSASDRLLYVAHSNGLAPDTTAAAVVTTLGKDGSIATSEVAPRDSGGPYWSPNGDRILLLGKQIKIVDVPADTRADGPWPSHEIVPPSGMVFDPLQIPSHGTGLVDGTFSADGRFVNFVLKREADSSRVLYAFPTSGDGPPRSLDSCPLSSDPVTRGCWPHGWLRSGATLFMLRPESDYLNQLVAWNPATGAENNLGNLTILDWLERDSSRLLMRDQNSGRTSIVDLRDITSPVFIDVPTADQPSFVGSARSPEGRWLLLGHQEEAGAWFDVVDVTSAPPWQAREIYRLGVGSLVRRTGSAGRSAVASSGCAPRARPTQHASSGSISGPAAGAPSSRSLLASLHRAIPSLGSGSSRRATTIGRPCLTVTALSPSGTRID